jgi:hypothetical protein
LKTDRRAFDLYDSGVSVQPSEKVRNSDRSPEFIDDHVGLTNVSIPEFGAWVFGEGVPGRFLPSSTRLSRASSSPEDIDLFLSWKRFERIHSDFFKVSIAADQHVARNRGEVSFPGTSDN